MILLEDGTIRDKDHRPKPLYADTENGRASIADRNVPYAEIKTSQDMLDFLAFLKQQEIGTRKADRPYQTVVIDTLDGFARKVAPALHRTRTPGRCTLLPPAA